jgi:hypothetical protein
MNIIATAKIIAASTRPFDCGADALMRILVELGSERAGRRDPTSPRAEETRRDRPEREREQRPGDGEQDAAVERDLRRNEVEQRGGRDEHEAPPPREEEARDGPRNEKTTIRSRSLVRESRSGKPWSAVSTALAVISGPCIGRRAPYGVGWASLSAAAVAPITATLSRNALGSTRPCSTSAYEYVGTVPGGPTYAIVVEAPIRERGIGWPVASSAATSARLSSGVAGSPFTVVGEPHRTWRITSAESGW